MAYCVNCGAGPVPPEQKFCGQCGTRIMAPAAVPVAPPLEARTGDHEHEPVPETSPAESAERIAILRSLLRGEVPLERLPDDEARRLIGVLGELPEGAIVRGLATRPPVSFAQAINAVYELAALVAHGNQEASEALFESQYSIRQLSLIPLERELLSDCICKMVAGLIDQALETTGKDRNSAQLLTAPSGAAPFKPAVESRPPHVHQPSPALRLSKQQRLAQEYAKDWWAAGRGSACCDRCGGDIVRGTGCLVKHSKDARLALGADLVCSRCFDDDDLPFNFRKGR